MSSKTANEWRARNPELARTRQRAYDLKKYGLTPDQWDSLFLSQQSRCAICASTTPRSERGWATDHDHATGKLRGILCQPCNKALGCFLDKPEVLRAAAAYVEKTQ